MGYSYEAYGSRRLCCDHCGQPGGVRKRTCAYKVVDYREDGTAYAPLPYCPAPALCSACYKDRGGLRGLHGDSCREGAAASQRVSDTRRDAYASGEMFVRAAWGRWHDSVPEGKTGLLYTGKEGKVYVLVPDDRYAIGSGSDHGRPTYSEIADVAEAWEGHPA